MENSMTEKKIQIGGQAVIEGVMMRGPDQIATAVRRKDGSIDLWKKDFVSVTKTNPIWKLPVIRGFVSLIEMMIIGVKTLNFSADRNMLDEEVEETEDTEETEETEDTEEEAQPSFWDKIFSSDSAVAVGMVLGIGVGLFLFGYLPYLLTGLLNISKQHVLFNLFAGSIRIILFVTYVFLISLMKDIKRVFEYHGAEHKSVFAHENKVELTIENVKPYTTIHPRCGTSFIFLVLLISILFFSILDTLVAMKWGIPTPLIRFLYHLPFVPIISGLGYEMIKLSDKKGSNVFVKLITKPGMALQKLTTKEPDDQQIETAIIALKAALNEDLSGYERINICEVGK
jgi:uncharacterized protein YqhQ